MIRSIVENISTSVLRLNAFSSNCLLRARPFSTQHEFTFFVLRNGGHVAILYVPGGAHVGYTVVSISPLLFDIDNNITDKEYFLIFNLKILK